jgi:hypothetical protein
MPRSQRKYASRNATHRALCGLAAIVLCLVALAGCGSSAEHSTATAAKQTQASSTRGETRADIVAAVEACKRGVSMGSWLPPESKRQLYTRCELGLKRGLTEIRAYGLEVCHEVAFTSPAKAEAEHTRVFDSCYAGVKATTALVHS